MLRPRDGIFKGPLDDAVLAMVLSFVPFLPLPLRWGLPFGLLYLEYAPAWFRYGRMRFSQMDPHTASRYLAEFERSGGPFLLLYLGLRSLVLMSFYQQPEILRALEIRWQSRAEELTDRRARLLRMTPEIGNPKNAGRRSR